MTYPIFTAHPDAPDGEVRRLQQYDPSLFTPDSIILCRNTAPLITFAYSLLQRDIPCLILGRDIGASLCALVRKMRAATLEDFSFKLKIWCEREVEQCHKEDRSPERIYDQYECLLMFSSSLDEQARTVDDLLAKIELMFTDDGTACLTLATVHKAKGMEFNTVFILDQPKYMPSRYAKKPWQIRQERNLLYVAVTRSKDKLYFINSENWKEI